MEFVVKIVPCSRNVLILTLCYWFEKLVLVFLYTFPKSYSNSRMIVE